MKALSGKQKTCKACREKFAPTKPMQAACSIKCAIALVNRDKAKTQKAESRKAMESIKPRSKYIQEAQQAFNAWVRARDAGRPCISCGGIPNDHGLITGSRIDAGHYRSVGACPELRFEPLNCSAQCVKCNRNLSGNTVEYRIRLVERIGADKVAWIEGPHPAKKYTIEDLKSIKEKYRKMARELKKA